MQHNFLMSPHQLRLISDGKIRPVWRAYPDLTTTNGHTTTGCSTPRVIKQAHHLMLHHSRQNIEYWLLLVQFADNDSISLVGCSVFATHTLNRQKAMNSETYLVTNGPISPHFIYHCPALANEREPGQRILYSHNSKGISWPKLSTELLSMVTQTENRRNTIRRELSPSTWTVKAEH